MIIYSLECLEPGCDFAVAVEGDRAARISMETAHRVETGHMRYGYAEQVGSEGDYDNS